MGLGEMAREKDIERKDVSGNCRRSPLGSEGKRGNHQGKKCQRKRSRTRQYFK